MMQISRLLALTGALFLTLFDSSTAWAKCEIYRGSSTSYSKLAANVRGDKIYRGSSSSYSNLIANLRGDNIYQGSSSSYSKLALNGPKCTPRELAFAAGALL